MKKNFSPARPRPLYHVTLNTGHISQHDLNGVHAMSATGFLPLLDARCGDIPGLPGFAFAFTLADRCGQFVLAHRGTEIITGGLAWGVGHGESLWGWLRDYYDCAVPKIPAWRASISSTPPPLPWLGVVLTTNIRFLSPAQLRSLGAVERDLALAIIRRALTHN